MTKMFLRWGFFIWDVDVSIINLLIAIFKFRYISRGNVNKPVDFDLVSVTSQIGESSERFRNLWSSLRNVFVTSGVRQWQLASTEADSSELGFSLTILTLTLLVVSQYHISLCELVWTRPDTLRFLAGWQLKVLHSLHYCYKCLRSPWLRRSTANTDHLPHANVVSRILGFLSHDGKWVFGEYLACDIVQLGKSFCKTAIEKYSWKTPEKQSKAFHCFARALIV